MIVIVTGMHRSGTSAIAGTLHHSEISMGEERTFYPPPMKENPKGFFEDKRFRGINDALLNRLGYSVKSFDPALPSYDEPLPELLVGRMRALITSMQDRENWGWKDPRTCLTLHYWFDVMNAMGIQNSEIKIVVAIRNSEDIAESMKRRGNKERLGKGQFHQLASAYYSRLYYTITDRELSHYEIHFTNLIESKAVELQNLSKYLGPILVHTFVDPSISKGS